MITLIPQWARQYKEFWDSIRRRYLWFIQLRYGAFVMLSGLILFSYLVLDVKYTVPKASYISIKIYNVLGKEVAVLVNEFKPVGNYEIEFNGKNLSSGIYFYKLQAGSYLETKKMVLLR